MIACHDPSHTAADSVVTGTLRDGPSPQAVFRFQDVSGIAVDSFGRTVVADRGRHRVDVFAPSHVFAYTLQMPAADTQSAFEPCCVTIRGRDTAWVLDVPSHRFLIFHLTDSAGRYQANIVVPPNRSGLYNRALWDSHGQLVHLADDYSERTGTFAVIRSVVTPDGEVVARDTLAPASADQVPTVVLRSPSGHGATAILQPLGPRLLRAFGPHGSRAEAISSHYAVALFDSGDGAPTRIITRPIDAPTVSFRERKSAEATLAALRLRFGVHGNLFPIPSKKPPLENLGFDFDGRLWVQHAVGDRDAPSADVFDPSGSFLATVAWPSSARLDLWAAHGDRALAVVDSAGGERVVELMFRKLAYPAAAAAQTNARPAAVSAASKTIAARENAANGARQFARDAQSGPRKTGSPRGN